jgi:NAD(P)H-nitrite reductase large subunit
MTELARRYVLIGAGVASMAAAEAIRRQDTHAEIVQVCEERDRYYSRPGLAYYLTGELDERQLFPYSDHQYQLLRLRLIHGRAVRIHCAQRQVELEGGARLPYDRLLIATGSAATKVSLPGVRLEGVVKLDCLEDARRISQATRKAHTAVVLGGGITALELVEAFIARRVKVHYFMRGDRYWSNVLDETESRIVEHRLAEEGVSIHYHTEAEEILGKNGRVAGVRTKDGKVIACQMVGIAVGITPRKELAVASGLRTDRGILVNEFLQTSDPLIYSAGDVAQVYDPFTGKSVLDSLWGPAREQGIAAGLNMTGKCSPYLKRMAFNVTRLANLTTTIIGTVGHGVDEDLYYIARGDSETWRALPDAIAAQANFDVNRLRILVGTCTLLGAIVMGDQTLSQPLQRLVSEQVDITPIRARLIDPAAPVADLIAEFWTSYLLQTQYVA